MATRKPVNSKAANTPAKPYQPTQRERAVVFERKQARFPAPSLKLDIKGVEPRDEVEAMLAAKLVREAVKRVR